MSVSNFEKKPTELVAEGPKTLSREQIFAYVPDTIEEHEIKAKEYADSALEYAKVSHGYADGTRKQPAAFIREGYGGLVVINNTDAYITKFGYNAGTKFFRLYENEWYVTNTPDYSGGTLCDLAEIGITAIDPATYFYVEMQNVPVSSGTPYYNNNSKYWCQRTESLSEGLVPRTRKISDNINLYDDVSSAELLQDINAVGKNIQIAGISINNGISGVTLANNLSTSYGLASKTFVADNYLANTNRVANVPFVNGEVDGNDLADALVNNVSPSKALVQEEPLIDYLDETFQTLDNLTTTISSSSSDINYPSAKAVYTSLADRENTSNKVTSLSSSSTDSQYPSAKVVYDQLATKENIGNKKSTISADPASTEYPTSQAVRNFVNSTVTTLVSNYVTYNTNGDPFPTRASLINASHFYYNGESYTPKKNDYTIVSRDENHNNLTARYLYTTIEHEGVTTGGWNYQYTLNDTSFTEAQLASINSGITSVKAGAIPGDASSSNLLVTSGKLIEVIGEGLEIKFRLNTIDLIEALSPGKTFQYIGSEPSLLQNGHHYRRTGSWQEVSSAGTGEVTVSTIGAVLALDQLSYFKWNGSTTDIGLIPNFFYTKVASGVYTPINVQANTEVQIDTTITAQSTNAHAAGSKAVYDLVSLVEDEVAELEETKQDQIQYTSLPSTAATGEIVQYTGVTNEQATPPLYQGEFYKYTGSAWVLLGEAPSGDSISVNEINSATKVSGSEVRFAHFGDQEHTPLDESPDNMWHIDGEVRHHSLQRFNSGVAIPSLSHIYSNDSLPRSLIITCKQSQYDALVEAGTVQNDTLYIILPATTYNITSTLSHVTAGSGNPSIIDEDDTVTLTFVADENYVLPDSVTVSGAAYVWSQSTGTLVLSSPMSDVSLTIIAVSAIPQLDTPANITADDTTIEFDAVENATSYEVFADGASIGEYAPSSGYTVSFFGQTTDFSTADPIYIKINEPPASENDYTFKQDGWSGFHDFGTLYNVKKVYIWINSGATSGSYNLGSGMIYLYNYYNAPLEIVIDESITSIYINSNGGIE